MSTRAPADLGPPPTPDELDAAIPAALDRIAERMAAGELPPLPDVAAYTLRRAAALLRPWLALRQAEGQEAAD